MKQRVAQSLQDRLFAQLQTLAVKGGRAPIGQSEVYSALARAGKIIVSVSGHNWRHVEIRDGAHVGATTQMNPGRHRVYLIVDANGPRRIE